MDLQNAQKRQEGLVYIVDGGRVVHLSPQCKRLRGKRYKETTLLSVRAKVDNPAVCTFCKKRVINRPR